MRAREFIVEDNESRTEEFHGVNMKIRDDGYEVVASALDDWDREMGSVVFNKGDGNELDPQDLLVIDKFRGQGIAKVMYDYVKSKGYEIHKSYDVTKIADQGKESGEYFWQKNRGEERIWEDESNDTAISLSKLGKFHPGADTLAEFVPERATAQYALHPDKWESTFYSLTNKDSEKLKYYGPKKISIPPGTLVGDMAIANKFYRAKTPEEQEQYAELYKASLQPYPVDVSEYRMPELLIPKQGVAEGQDDNGISFQIQKGKNKFATTLSIGNNSVGVYQYDANTGRSIAEVYPEFKGKGLGKLLVLHAIYTAAKLGLDFQEDESRTSEYDNVLDSLSGSGYIVDDEGYWYVTGEGEQFLKQSLKQGVAEGSSNNIPTTGINVRSDGNIDYASLIVDGEKKYESRKTDSLRPYVGKTVGIVRTGNGPAVAIGQVTIGEPIVVDAEKFNRLRKQHLVPQGSKFDIDSDGTKYLYPMIDPVRWDNEKLIKHKGIVSRKIEEDKSKDPIVNAVIDFYKHVGKIHKDPIDDYVSTAKEMLGHVDDPTLKSKLLDIFKQAKQNPYIQGGVVTTIGALLAGGVLSSAQKMGLSPSQTNLALQAILNTVIPTVVSRINGKSWSDTIKYTLASAGIGTGIAGMMEEDSLDEDWKSALATGAMAGAMAMGANAKAPNMVQQIVEPGDTVYSIARQNNVNPLEIYKLNKMSRTTKLEIGQKVLVPDYSKPISKMPATVKPTIKQEPAKVAQPAPSFKDKISSMMPKFSQDEEEGVTLLSDNTEAESALQTAAKAAGLKGSELAQFMAQTRHESWDFSKMKEVGNKKTFAKYEKPKMAKRLGNKAKGDGELFKGRGFIQLTGRDNYTRASQQIFGDDRLVKNPDLASRLDVGAKVALWFWKNQVRPNVSNFNNTTEVVNAINSGEPKEVIKKRHIKFKEYLAVL